MAESSPAPVTSLYIHVPFCVKKCEYCAFFSEAASGELIHRYVAALVRELEMVADDLRPKTIFFGGGTPSILNLDQWKIIFHALERLNLTGAEEFTIECNPATVSADKAKLFRDFGVNRLSMGVQSFDEKLLDRLGRIHSRAMVFKSFDILRHAGFDNVNLDLMFAIPTQTMEIWRDTLNEALAMQSEHLSSYEVIYEDDTPLFEQLQAGEFSVDENLACEMYDELILQTSRAGVYQYEISNFARHPTAQLPASENSRFRLPSQRQLLARRLVLRPRPQRHRLRPRRADKELVEHAALLRTTGKRRPRHRITRGTVAAAPGWRNRRVRPAHERRLAVCRFSAGDRVRFAHRLED
jgi:coproporphyrinogen III oxidase-like Fe-S oxidoreductase